MDGLPSYRGSSRRVRLHNGPRPKDLIFRLGGVKNFSWSGYAPTPRTPSDTKLRVYFWKKIVSSVSCVEFCETWWDFNIRKGRMWSHCEIFERPPWVIQRGGGGVSILRMSILKRRQKTHPPIFFSWEGLALKYNIMCYLLMTSWITMKSSSSWLNHT